MPIDIINYLRYLDQERYRAIILHTKPDLSQSLMSFSKKLCKQVNGKYINLLNLFLHSKELSSKIDTYRPEKLKDFLVDEGQNQPLIIVDQADFLIDTWRKSEKKDFFHIITRQWDGYIAAMKSKLIFALQTSHEIESLKLIDSKGKSRIFRLEEFNNIS